MAAVAITRTDLSAAELRTSAARMKDARAVRRTLAIALVLDGTSRAAATRASGMDRQTLRDWVHRYNAGGLDGLSDQWAPGPEPALTQTQEQALIGWVELGPDLRPERALLARVPLGPRPSLHRRRRRLPGFVRRLRRYYGGV